MSSEGSAEICCCCACRTWRHVGPEVSAQNTERGARSIYLAINVSVVGRWGGRRAPENSFSPAADVRSHQREYNNFMEICVCVDWGPLDAMRHPERKHLLLVSVCGTCPRSLVSNLWSAIVFACVCSFVWLKFKMVEHMQYIWYVGEMWVVGCLVANELPK